MLTIYNFLRILCLIMALICRNTLAERDEWCDGDHDHGHNETEVHPEDFLVEIFKLYGDNLTCTIQHDGYEQLISDLGIGHGTHDAHTHNDVTKGVHNIEQHSVDHNCYDSHDLLQIHNVSDEVGISQEDFIFLCPSFIQQIVQGCQEHKDTNPELSPGAIWGYGIISVTIVSSAALLGLIIARWRHTTGYKYLLTVMLGLAVGTLLSDSLIHLIPHGLGLHDHDSHSHTDNGVESFVWKTLLACLAAYGFFNLQVILQYFQAGESHMHSHAMVSPVNSVNNSAIDLNEVTSETSNKHTKTSYDLNGTTQQSIDNELPINDGRSDIEKAPDSVGWMVAIGDAFHNFADGLALGAAYSDSWQTGLGTTIAIVCHEIPHEFGDVAAMLSVGWSWKKVLLLQCLSQTTAYLGLFIGIPVSENEEARSWILIMTAGMFLYISLSDIVPELMGYFKPHNYWKIFAAANGGILLGFIFMLSLAVLEEHVHIE